VAVWCAAIVHGAGNTGVSYQLVPSRSFYAPVDTASFPNTLTNPDPAFLELKSKQLRKEVFVDFEKRQVELVRYYQSSLTPTIYSGEDSAIAGVRVWSYMFMELNEYLEYNNTRQLADAWRKGNPFFELVEKERKAFNVLDIQIPVKLPAWARRVVGSEGPRLTISGMFKITIGGNSNWTKGSNNIDNQNEGFPDISVKQDMNFTVTGKIGRLINVSISTDNTQDIQSELKKQMKIHYKGETENELEDDIIQEIEAGYTNFAMPGAEFDGYSESHEGLFGIKARMKLGDFELTTIISQEEGQNKSDTINPSSDKSATSLTDKEIYYDKLFFLDTNYYYTYYKEYFNQPQRTVPRVTKAYVLKKESTPTFDQFRQNPTEYPNHRRIGDGIYKILRSNTSEEPEYYLDETRGFIALQFPLSQKSDQLLAYFETASFKSSGTYVYYIDSEHEKAGIPESTSVDGNIIHPYRLRPDNPSKTDPTWVLSWKNVYELGAITVENRDKVSLAMKYIYDSQNPREKIKIKGRDTLLTSFFGITDANGNPYVKNADIFMFDYGVLAFPALCGPTPFNDLERLAGDSLLRNPKIYDHLAEDQGSNEISAIYQIEIHAVSTRTSFSLNAINILEGSEKVRIGSATLTRDVDYIINYEVGQITLISDRAINSASKISVEFEYSPFFVPEEKTFMAARAEYKLPAIGKESFIAASVLRKSETSQDKRAQVGREPSSNMVFDLNTKLNWEPEWMTSAVNNIPLIRTDEKSQLSFSAEYAHSMVNPNRSDRAEALIDDFEDSKTLFSIPISYINWHWASEPLDPRPDFHPELQCWGGNGREEKGPLADVGWFSWFSKDTQTVSIWPGSATRTDKTKYLGLVLRPHARRAGAEGAAAAGSWLKKASWGGIMSKLGYGVASQLDNAQYIEIWVRVADGDQGVLHIDLGELSEDLRIAKENSDDPNDSTSIVITNANPDGKMNDEWYNRDLQSTSMTPRTDLGLDMRLDQYEKFLAPMDCGLIGRICFDTITPARVADPAGDNFNWTLENNNWETFNGTQSNGSGESFDRNKNLYPDNEDLFYANGQVDRTNKYFHYEINLQKNSSSEEPYLVTEDAPRGGWRLYRIPILKPKSDSIPFRINDPKLVDATGIRVWYNGIEKSSFIQIARMEIVGNKWISRDTATVIASSDSGAVSNPEPSHRKTRVSVVNTVDNRDVYQRPSFVPRYYDSENNIEIREQSLKIEYDSLSLRERESRAIRFFQQPLDFRNYKKLVLYYQLHASDARNGEVAFFFRFGTDSLRYYEYRCTPTVRSGASWDSMVVDLSEIALLKQYEIVEQKKLVAEKGALRVVGSPTFANVQWLAMGFAIDTTRPNIDGNDYFSGSIFVNDCKLTEPELQNGNAARMSLSSKFADFIDLTSGVYYLDGSFLKLTEKRQGGGESQLSLDVNSTIQMSKFVPAKWGVAVPLNLSINSSVKRPRFISNSDVFLSEDGLGDMGPRLVNLITSSELMGSRATESERYEETRTQRSISTSYSKNKSSDNLVVNLLADRIRTGGNLSVIDAKNVQKYETNYAYNTNLTYEARAAEDRKFTPFKNIKTTFLNTHLSDLTLFYYPNTFNFEVYKLNYTKSFAWDRTTLDAKEGRPVAYQLSMSHGYTMNFNLLEWKHLDLSVNHTDAVTRNLNDFVTQNDGLKANAFSDYVLKYDPYWNLQKGNGPARFILYGETSDKQSFDYAIEPKIVEWLTHDFSYRSDYSHSINNKTIDTSSYNYLDMNTSTNFNTGVDWMFVKMFEAAGNLIGTERSKSVTAAIKKPFAKLNFSKIGFDYSVGVNRRLGFLRDMPLTPSQYLLFRGGLLGLSPYNIITGTEDKTMFGAWKYRETTAGANGYFVPDQQSTSDGRDVNMTASTNTGVTLPFLLNMSVNASARYTMKYGEKAGYVTVDTTVEWPDISINARVSDIMPLVKNLPIAGEYTQSASVNSGFTYKKSTNIRFDKENISKRSGDFEYLFGMSPLVSLVMTFKNAISLNNGLDWSLRRKYSDELLGMNDMSEGNEEYSLKDALKLNYTFKKNRTLKLLLWEITLNNQLDMFAGYEYTRNWTYKWDIRSLDRKTVYRTYTEYMDAKKIAQPELFTKTMTHAINGGFNYNITDKMKSGAELGWKRKLEVPKGNQDDDASNTRTYDVNVQLWVQWNF